MRLLRKMRNQKKLKKHFILNTTLLQSSSMNWLDLKNQNANQVGQTFHPMKK